MKKTFSLVAVFVLSLQNAFGDPKTFAEFQQLSVDERRTMVRDRNNPMHSELVRWQWRLQLGEAGWEQKELTRIVERNGNSELESLFDYYRLIRQEYAKEKLDALNFDDLSTKNQEMIKQLQSEDKAARDQYSQAIKTASFLASSPELQALNRKADIVLGAWAKDCPIGGKWTLDDSEMKSITSAYQAFISAMQKLSALSNDQIRSTLDSLPKDHPPRGFMY